MAKDERALKERMETRKENFMLRVDTHTDMAGQGLSKITPLMTQATSALTVGYAAYEGVNMFFNAHWTIAVLVGLVAGIATEGIGFIAVDERDKAEAHNRRTADETQKIDMTKANAYVAGSFAITFLIVAAFESIPSVIRFWNADATLAEMLFRCGLLVFPFLSRLGANLFAFRSVRESVDTLADDQELRKLKLSLAKQELIAKSETRVENVRGKIKNHESRKSVTISPENAPLSDENQGVNSDEITPNLDAANAAKQRKIEMRKAAIVGLIHAYGPMSAPELSEKLMSDRGIKAGDDTVRNDCNQLVSEGQLVRDGKKWNISQPIMVEVPVIAEPYLNGHGKH